MQTRKYWTDSTTWSCHLGILSYGALTAMLGSVLPSLSETVHLSPAQGGSLFLFLNFGALVGTVSIGAAFDRFGFRSILIAASAAAAAGFFWLVLADSYLNLVGASFLLGASGALVNLGTNALISDLYPQEQGVALNRLGGFFGVGSFLAPFLVGLLLERGGLGVIFSVGAGISLVPALIFLGLSFPAPKHSTGLPLRDLKRAVSSPVIGLLALLLLFQAGAEATTGAWLTTFLVDHRGASPATASLVLSLFWGSFVVGRLSASRLLGRMAPETLVQAGSVGGGLFLCLLLVVDVPFAPVVTTLLAGLSMSMVFPTVIAQATVRYPAFSGTVIGTLLSVALLGSMSMPWLTGLLSGLVGLPFGFCLPILCTVAVIFLQRSAIRWPAAGQTGSAAKAGIF